MTCVIVDDNELAIESLSELLKHFCPDVHITATAQTVKKATEAIRRFKPDIVFLDVEMNNESGFDLLPHFPHPDFLVIFTTSHEKYAIKAFKTDCFDYLLKPIDPIELKNSINKIKNENLLPAKNTNDSNPKNLIDSLNYAKRIQNSILVAEYEIHKHIPELFILYLPKDIVSGDFYWFSVVNNNQDYILVAADCTGHGVPGAFLSMIGSTLLNEIVNQKHISDPIKIMQTLAEGISSTLLNKEKDTEYDDGMDISVCRINKKQKKIYFGGANHTMYLANNNQINKFDSQVNSVNGIFDIQNSKLLQTEEISLTPETMIYLATDGYADQIGEASQKKFQTNRLEVLLKNIYNLPAEKQKQILESTFYDWRGNVKQTDDILIIGFRI